MRESREWSGRKGYIFVWKNGKNQPKHRVIWENTHGPIPPDFDVHHRNGDPKDNRLENLELISHPQHARLSQTGRHYSEETRRKMSEARKGRPNPRNKRPRSEEEKAQISAKLTGRHLSEETRRKLSAALKGHPGYTKGCPAWNKGIPCSDEARRKISAAKKGCPSPFKGRPLSAEHRKKLSEAQQRRYHPEL